MSTFKLNPTKLVELYLGNNLITNFSPIYEDDTYKKILILDISSNLISSQDYLVIKEKLFTYLKKLKVLDGLTIDTNQRKEVNDKLMK